MLHSVQKVEDSSKRQESSARSVGGSVRDDGMLSLHGGEAAGSWHRITPVQR